MVNIPAGMPPGVLGYWNPSDIQTAPVHVIPNRATNVPVEANQIRLPRNAFNYVPASEYTWVRSPTDANTLVVDRAAPARDGTLTASRVTMTAGGVRILGANTG